MAARNVAWSLSARFKPGEASYGGYPGRFEWEPGVGHQVPDLDKLAEMLKAPWRKPQPARIVWAQSDDVLKHFYWVEAPHPSPRDASRPR